MRQPDNPSTTPLWRSWAATLPRASAAYWGIQTAVCVLLFVATSAVVDHASHSASSAGWWLRPTFEAGWYFLTTHVGIRPYLRLRMVERSPVARDWWWLAGWLAMVSFISLAGRVAFDAHAAAQGIAMLAESSLRERDSDLLASPALRHALSALNLFATHALWSGLYLGLKAVITHRRMQSQVEAARLAQLGNQLSPHFLFNALNSIRALVFENPAKAADLITQLSELLRSHLQIDFPRTQTLQEEWALARRYLDIEAVRLEERLETDVVIDEACLSRRLPSLALLSLVENAIKHGIAVSAEPGVLHIEARTRQGGWYLEVRNPWRSGVGSIGAGTGLPNLDERLGLAFGSRARMQVTRNERSFAVRLDFDGG